MKLQKVLVKKPSEYLKVSFCTLNDKIKRKINIVIERNHNYLMILN